MRILVMNGPNLGALGERQPEIYGSQGMDALPALVRAVCGGSADGVDLVFYQSNHEGNFSIVWKRRGGRAWTELCSMPAR